MTTDMQWSSGLQGFRKHSLNDKQFTTHLTDCDFDIKRNFSEILNDHVTSRQTKYVELLYSGGMDSELVLLELMKINVPVIVITMVIKIKGVILNTHDLYYSEKFCRQNNINQKLIEFDAYSFFENGDYLSYLTPYSINEPHVASHFWLIKQCDYFPIMGGDWPWAQLHKEQKVLSPFRIDYSMYLPFMKDNGINGIDNMLCYSLDSSMKLIELQKNTFIGSEPVSFLKERMYKKINNNLEGRIRSYGWEVSKMIDFNLNKYKIELIKKNNVKTNKIVWGNHIRDFLETTETENSKFQ